MAGFALSTEDFERHLALIEPQRRYFEELRRLAPNSVITLSADVVVENVRVVVESVRVRREPIGSLSLFDGLMGWLRAEVA